MLDVDSHTNFLNKSERDRIKVIGQKIEDVAKAVTNTGKGGISNTYKENRFGRLLREDMVTNPHYGLLDEVSPEEKVKLLNQLVSDFLHDLGLMAHQ
ncbi:MAG: hypothetical protein LBT51_09600 [Fusobacteriaceae bacterium]|jgi:filamentous hemagglutinin|nr:hypothetical protein [Fusobacteriaceae bacterium]